MLTLVEILLHLYNKYKVKSIELVLNIQFKNLNHNIMKVVGIKGFIQQLLILLNTVLTLIHCSNKSIRKNKTTKTNPNPIIKTNKSLVTAKNINSDTTNWNSISLNWDLKAHIRSYSFLIFCLLVVSLELKEINGIICSIGKLMNVKTFNSLNWKLFLILSFKFINDVNWVKQQLNWLLKLSVNEQ